MQLEEYFDFFGTDDIRIKGTRVGIETVLCDDIYRGQHPEEIVTQYPSLTLEQVYATILYYLHNQETVTAYLAEWLDFGQRMRAAQALDPAFQDFMARVRQLSYGHNQQLVGITAGRASTFRGQAVETAPQGDSGRHETCRRG